jgi:hypothetical protein
MDSLGGDTQDNDNPQGDDFHGYNEWLSLMAMDVMGYAAARSTKYAPITPGDEGIMPPSLPGMMEMTLRQHGVRSGMWLDEGGANALEG